ncbi:hypothetical protein BAC2_03057 [uncultured bacterium]|nr:hypothetical protein BAC2_03057 [uncultured bacterium]
MEHHFVYIWEFEVPAAMDAEFQRHYGPGGSWAALFRRDPAYIETILLADASTPGHYLTIDRWQSERAYRSFRERFAQQYEALDKVCERLTRRESSLGSFFEVVSNPAA